MFGAHSSNKFNKLDLTAYISDSEKCEPGHFWGPGVRQYYIIHIILSGKGIFQTGGKTYELSKGQAFLICPGNIVYYQADMEEPWTYSWVAFDGIKARTYLIQANLGVDNPVFRYDNTQGILQCFEGMVECGRHSRMMKKSEEVRFLAHLLHFLSLLIEQAESLNQASGSQNTREYYVNKAIEFIALHFDNAIGPTEIARYVGLNRNYLCSLFKEQLNISTQEFLLDFRINKACEFMENSSYSIGDIARSIGYTDPLLFSRMFKKLKKLSPTEYRKTMSHKEL